MPSWSRWWRSAPVSLLLVAVLGGLAMASTPMQAPLDHDQSGRTGADSESSAELMQRANYFADQRAGMHGVPPGARVRAIHKAHQLPTAGPSLPSSTAGNASTGPSATVPSASPGFQWGLVGPKPITGGADPSGPWSGRVASLAPDPNDPTGDTVYLGAASGGVWKTTNGGSSWKPLTDDALDSPAIGALAVQPGSQVVLAGTGESNFSSDSYYGAGIWRSTDAGATWSRAVTDADITDCTTSRIVFDPAAPDTVFAGVVDPGTYAGPGSGTGCANPGLYMSTDAGASWTRKDSRSITDIVVNPADSTKWYMGAEGDGVYPFSDAGVVGTKLAIPASVIDRIALAIAPTDPQTMYAAFTSSSTFDFNAAGAGIFTTTTGPAGTWSAFTTTTGYKSSSNFLFPWYALALQVDRTTPGTLYVASGPGLVRFTSLGAAMSAPSQPSMHADFHALAYDGTRLWIGTDGGVYSTDDAFATVQNRNANLALTQFDPGASSSTGGVLAGGTQDNGSLHTGTVLDWPQLPLGCDGGWGNVNAADPTDIIFTPQSGCGGYYIARWHNGTVSMAQSGINTGETGLFYSPVVASPTDPNQLYYGRTHLWTSGNRGASWAAYSSTQTFGSTISAVGASSSTSTVYVGTTAGHVWSTAGGGAGPWTDSTLPAYVTGITVDPSDPATAYASVSGFGHGHLYKTVNSGGTWTQVDATLGVDAPANSVAVDWRAGRGQIYSATDVGTFVSGDGGTTWADATPGMPRVIAMSVVVDTSMDRLVVFTHGRGVWAAALGTNPPDTTIASGPPPAVNVTTAAFSLTSNPPGATFQCKLDDEAFETCSANPSYSGLLEGDHTFQARAVSSLGSDQTPAIKHWTVDTAPPDTSITSQPQSLTSATTADISFDSTEAGGTFQCSLDQAPFATCTSPVHLSGLSSTGHEFQVRAIDAATNVDGSPASASWTVDAIAPVPVLHALPTFTTSRSVPVSWGTSGPEAAASYDVRYSSAAYSTTVLSSPTTWLPSTTATSRSLSGQPGRTYCFQVRARDDLDNVSGWTSYGCGAVPVDDRSLSGSGWTKLTGSGWYLGTAKTSSHKGTALTLTGVKTRRIALLATRCPGCGKVDVFLGKTRLKSINLNATSTKKLNVIAVASYATVHSGTLRIVITTAGLPVRIDGVGLKLR